MAIIKLSATEQRRLSVFFSCLVLAIVAWIMVTLSRNYTYTVRRTLAFKNVPQRRAFHSLQPDTINVLVKGSGWQMLFAKMNNGSKPIHIDLHTLDRENFIVLNTQLKAINRSREVGHEVVDFDPDTLYFDFSNRSIKRVPVKLVSGLVYEQQYAQSGSVVIKPAYVTITGPSSIINNIHFWKTDSLKATNLDETINTQVALEGVKEGNISIYPKSVKVIVPVNEYTEKTVEVPVQLVNNSDYYSVNILPKKVKVTFTTSLDRYSEVTEEYFEVQADLYMWKSYSYKMLPVKVTKLPDYCKIVKVEPQYVDFIIKK